MQRLGRELLGRERVDIAYQVVIPRQRLGILDLDAPLAVSRNGIDAGLEGAAADVFQQGRVALLAHCLLVDAAGFLFGQELAFHLLAVNVHAEVGDGGVIGQGEEVRALQLTIRVIDKDLVDLGLRDLVVDGNVDAMILDGEGERQGWN